MYSDLHRSIVTLQVGADKYPFYIHKGLLCRDSHFFKAAFDGSFEEATTGTLHLKEDDVEEVKIFEEWLYHPNKLEFPKDHDEPSFLLIKLFCFAHRVGIESLQNDALDAIRDLAIRPKKPHITWSEPAQTSAMPTLGQTAQKSTQPLFSSPARATTPSLFNSPPQAPTPSPSNQPVQTTTSSLFSQPTQTTAPSLFTTSSLFSQPAQTTTQSTSSQSAQGSTKSFFANLAQPITTTIYLPPASAAAVTYAYEHTVEGSPLRRLLSDIFAYNVKSDSLQESLLSFPQEFVADVALINMKRLPLRLANETVPFEGSADRYYV